jgi:hypothetical protein
MTIKTKLAVLATAAPTLLGLAVLAGSTPAEAHSARRSQPMVKGMMMRADGPFSSNAKIRAFFLDRDRNGPGGN